ncbi:histidine kinase [Cryptosporangium phraense]|uniref:Uncharacterized protein n=1 Tax=Cryptosporangium phraense TaxID=2593070 RepID=A0A545AM40_9ACTN|nr:histidine kinase [Cryptosporangium phraense]TQS42397.1 hypothetical protein FL583_24100 [Cryptosporangium phraense]
MQLVGRSRILVTAALGVVVVGLEAVEAQRPPELGPVVVAVAFALVAGVLNGFRPGLALPAAWWACGLLWPLGRPGAWGTARVERLGEIAFWIALAVAVGLYVTAVRGAARWAPVLAVPLLPISVVAALLVLATAVVAATLRSRIFQLRVVQRVAELPRPITGDALRAALRQALADPALEIAYWSPGVGVHLDADGHEVPEPEGVAVPDLAVLSVTARRRVLAVLDLITPALAAARLHAVSNAHRTQARALQAGWAERRELEQLLHDSAQTRLSALTVRLGVARSHETDERAGRVLADAQAQLGLALRELRELAHGIHSMTLTESGLGPALDAAASRYGVPALITVPPERLAPDAETLAYYAACWVFANHRRGGVEVVGTLSDGVLRLRIDGADLAGTDSSAMALRIRAAGGLLTISESAVDVTVPSR